MIYFQYHPDQLEPLENKIVLVVTYFVLLARKAARKMQVANAAQAEYAALTSFLIDAQIDCSAQFCTAPAVILIPVAAKEL